MAVVGEVAISVTADAKRFIPALKKQLSDAEKAAESGGNKLGGRIDNSLTKVFSKGGFPSAFKKQLSDAEKSADTSGTKMGSRLGTALSKALPSGGFLPTFKKHLAGAENEADASGTRLGSRLSSALSKALPSGGGFLSSLRKQFSEAAQAAEHGGTEVGRSFDRALTKALPKGKGSSAGGLGASMGAMIAAVPIATSLLSSLAGAATALAGSLIQAGTAVASQVGIYGALGQAVLVAKIAFGGLGKALGGDEKAMKALTPVQRQLAEAIKGLEPAWKGFKASISDTVLAGLGDQVSKIGGTLIPVLQKNLQGTGTVMNWLLNRLAGFVTSKRFVNDFGIALRGNTSIFRTLSKAAVPLLRGILNMFIALQPAANRWAGVIVKAARAFAAWAVEGRKSGAIAGYMERAQHSMSLVWNIAKNLAIAFKNIFMSGADSGDGLLKVFGRLAESFRKFTESASGKNAIKSWMDQGMSVFMAFGRVIGTIAPLLGALFEPKTGAGFMSILEESLPGIIALIKALMDAFAPMFKDIGIAFGGLALSLAKLVVAASPLIKGLGMVIGQLFIQMFSTISMVIDIITPLVYAISSLLGPAIQKLSPWIAAFILAFTNVGGAITNLIRYIPLVGGKLAMLTGPFAKLYDLIYRKVAFAFSFLSNVVGMYTPQIGKAIGYLGTAVIIASKFFIAAGGQIIGAIKAVASAVLPAMTAIGNIIAAVFGAIGNLVKTMWPVFTAIIIGAVKVWWTVVSTEVKLIWAVISTVFNAIKAVVQAVWGFIGPFVVAYVKLWWNVISTTLSAIKSIVTSVFNLIKSVITTAMNVVKAVITAVWNAIKAVVTTVVARIWQIIRTDFNLMKSIVTTVMNAVLAVIRAVWNAIWSVVSAILTRLVNGLRNEFNLMRSIITSVMNAIRAIISTVWNAIRSVVSSVVGVVVRLVTGAWNTIRNSTTSVWNGIHHAITSTLSGIQNAFRSTVDRVRSIWDGLKAAAARPVNFLIETVWNNGIVKLVGLLPGGNPLHSMSPIRFSGGGKVWGPGSETSDSILARLSKNEFVVRAAQAKKYRPLLEAINTGSFTKAFKPGRAKGLFRRGHYTPDWWKGDVGVQGLAGGGIAGGTGGLQEHWMGPFENALAFANSQAGKPYIYGGVGPRGYDCSGFMSAITNVIRGRSPYSRVGSTANFPWPGFSGGWGPFTIGSSDPYPGSRMGHMAGTLLSKNVESTNGSVRVGSRARGAGDAGFRQRAHLGPGDSRWATTDLGAFFTVIPKMLSKVKEIVGWIGQLGASAWGKMLALPVAKMVANGAVNWLNSKLPGSPIHLPHFAKGTNFAPGGTALVGERGPELVTLPRGSQVTPLAGGTPKVASLPRRVILRIGSRDFEAYIEELADGRVRAADSLSWQGA